MAVSIDTVYQRVLAFANKEQRGYITPQQFNLFADQAQQEIFEQYFYDINQWNRQHGNSTGHSDMLSNLEEKLSLFNHYNQEAIVTGIKTTAIDLVVSFPDLYRLIVVKVDYSTNTRFAEAEEIKLNELTRTSNSPLYKWSKKRPVYTLMEEVNGNHRMRVYPYVTPSTVLGEDGVTPLERVLVSYIRKPIQPNWAYVVVHDKTLYNDNVSVDFELHASDESELVYRILAYAGITIKKPELTQMAMSLEGSKVQQEKQ